jgi:hypothetical protein
MDYKQLFETMYRQMSNDICNKLEEFKNDTNRLMEHKISPSLVSEDSFFYKVIDYDGGSFKEGFSSVSSSQDQLSEVLKSKCQEKYYAYSESIRRLENLNFSNLKTTENNPFELIFDIDNQVEVITHNLIYQKAIYNYKSSPWISDIIRTIKDILSYNFDSNIFDCKSISDRLDLISNMYNIIEHRMALVLYGVFKHGFYSKFYEEDTYFTPNPIKFGENKNNVRLADSYRLFSSTQPGDEIDLSSLFTLEEFEIKFHEFIEKGFFSNIKARSVIIGILSQRDYNHMKSEFISIKFSDLYLQIRQADSIIFKMAASYIVLRAKGMYNFYNFKHEFNCRNDHVKDDLLSTNIELLDQERKDDNAEKIIHLLDHLYQSLINMY